MLNMKYITMIIDCVQPLYTKIYFISATTKYLLHHLIILLLDLKSWITLKIIFKERAVQHILDNSLMLK